MKFSVWFLIENQHQVFDLCEQDKILGNGAATSTAAVTVSDLCEQRVDLCHGTCSSILFSQLTV